jgi:hypothetical protein
MLLDSNPSGVTMTTYYLTTDDRISVHRVCSTNFLTQKSKERYIFARASIVASLHREFVDATSTQQLRTNGKARHIKEFVI